MAKKKPNRNIEYETKVLDIDPKEIISKLRKLGAKETPERLMRRYVYDIKIRKLENIRIRDNGDNTTTLTYKKRNNYGVDGTEELEVQINDFDKTSEIFSKLKFKNTFYQENKRKSFILDEIEFDLNTWPLIGTHLEIEATSKEAVQKGLRLLGLEGKDIGNIPAGKIYRDRGFKLAAIKNLKF